VSADTIRLLGTGQISSSTAGTGQAGTVDVTARAVLADGAGRTDFNTGIFSETELNTFSGVGAAAGTVSVHADSITLVDRGQISSSSVGAGRGGDVTIGPNSRPLSILVTGPGAGIEAASSGPQAAGAISINADTVTVRDSGTIATEAALGGGGTIGLEAGHLIYLNRGGITTSVAGGTGNGGNITLSAPFTALNDGTVKANAVGGNGGNIHIVTSQYLKTPDSLVQASSQTGISGTIVVQAPANTVTASLAELSGRLLGPPAVRQGGCAGAAEAEKGSSLTFGGRGGLPRDAEGPQIGRYFVDGSVPLPVGVGPPDTLDRPAASLPADAARACWRGESNGGSPPGLALGRPDTRP
jgi:hypothetical protein